MKQNNPVSPVCFIGEAGRVSLAPNKNERAFISWQKRFYLDVIGNYKDL
jgi:hypothetical protein